MSVKIHYKKETIKTVNMKTFKNYKNRFLPNFLSTINLNVNFVIMVFLGSFSLIFEPTRLNSWHIENGDLIYSLITGTGISGIICWYFTFKFKNLEGGKWRFNLPYFLWLICHLLAITTFFYFLLLLGIRKDGTFSGLALGIFFGLVLYSPLSIIYNTLYGNLK